MSEKPAFFPEESEAARIAPATLPPLGKKKKKNPLHGHQREKPESEGEREKMCSGENGEGDVSKWSAPGEERFF